MFQRGFSLIEVMISSVLLSIGLAAIATAFSSAASLEGHQERVTVGMHLAEARVEELLVAYPSDASLNAGTHGPVLFTRSATLTTSAVTGANAPAYTVTWTIDAGPIARTRRVVVDVAWTESSGAQHVSLTTHRT
jgi:prepilin-type N-terminal cleavage/methylation domain-containing protein